MKRRILSILLSLGIAVPMLLTSVWAAQSGDGVQAMIDALPSAGEVADMDLDGQRAAYDQTQAAYDAYTALNDEERAPVTGAEVFEELFDFFNAQIMLLDDESTGNNAPEPGIGMGVSGLLDPDTATTRAVIAAALWRLEGSPVVNYAMNFSDVSSDAPYAEAVRWAASTGIVEGYGDGRFGSDDVITREQLAVMLYRYKASKSGGDRTIRPDYSDAADISDWAYEAMSWCTANGVVQSLDNGMLQPRSQATYAQAAAMLTRFCEL